MERTVVSDLPWPMRLYVCRPGMHLWLGPTPEPKEWGTDVEATMVCPDHDGLPSADGPDQHGHRPPD